MVADLASFRARFGADEHQVLADASDDAVEEGLELALSIFRATEIGSLYLAAHFTYLHEKEKPNPGAGVLTSEGKGPFSESYRAAAADDDHGAIYDTTSYGRRYLVLKRAATNVRVGYVKGGTISDGAARYYSR